jgi:transposase
VSKIGMTVGPAIPEPKLPDDLAVCNGMLRELLGTSGRLHKRIDHLEHQLDQLFKRLYGPRADRLNPEQGTSFGDPRPDPASPPPVEPPPPPSPHAKPQKGHGRAPMPANLRRERVVIDIPEAEKHVVRSETQCDELKVADLPSQALPRCKAAPGLVADIVVSKLVGCQSTITPPNAP